MQWFDVRLLQPRSVFGLCVAILGGLVFACGPAAPMAAPTPAPDPFAVVRATSQAAYQTGKAYLDRGDLQGCPYIDTAKTTDPDNRPEIQQVLEGCLTAIAQMTPAAAPTPVQRTIAVPTLVVPAAVAPSPSPPAATPAPPTLAAATKPTALAASKPTGVSSPVADAASLSPWRDPQGRFTLSAPSNWARVEQPQSLLGIGTGVVDFVEPSGRAELGVAVDTANRAVSPELYAASLDIAMQRQVPGYAGEQVQPGSTSGNPSVRRVFTFTQRDSTGRDVQARAFQTTVLKGSTPYIISGWAPAEQFQQFSPTFDQMVESFRFS